MATESSIGESFRGIIEAVRDHAGVETAFGEPIEREGRTVVPVARVAYGFGGGFGEGAEVERDEDGEESAEVGGSGGGGGGGAMTRPLGVIEVTDHETRFVPLGDRRRSLAVAGVAFLVGLLLGRSLARDE
ncbi:MAG: spore germination protein GerW family protein [archaeon]